VTTAERYFRFLLHLVGWWSIALGIMSGIILLCILLDWVGHVGWGYPWYAAVIAVAMIGVALGVRKLASKGLRTIGR
jgi:hypothetical protein